VWLAVRAFATAFGRKHTRWPSVVLRLDRMARGARFIAVRRQLAAAVAAAPSRALLDIEW
jgi:hypothetical protein